MNSIRLLSGRVPVTDLANLTADRYQFLSVTQAEPNLGNGYSSTDVLTLGTNGVRVWANALNVTSVSASGNITASYFFGNGSQLTGIVPSAANISNGTSNISIPVASGNIYVVVNGSNIATFTTTGISLTGNVTANNGQFTTAVNAASHTGGLVSVTGNVIGNNASITNIANAASFTGGLLSISGNVTGGNGQFTTAVNTTSFTGQSLSVTGNVTSDNLNAVGLSLSGNLLSALNANTNITTTEIGRAHV